MIYVIRKNKSTDIPIESKVETPVKNLETAFSIDEIILYSSANAKKSQNLSYGLDISQFTDISFYISNPTGKEIKELKISEIFFDPFPKLGNPMLVYKNPVDFGRLVDFDVNFADEIDFKVVNKETENFSTPTVYNNLSSPITLTYINSNVRKSFIVNKNETFVYYDGRLLKVAGIDLSKLNCKVFFKVTIVDMSDKSYESKISFEIPYKDEDKIISNGSVLKKLQVHNEFYSY